MLVDRLAEACGIRFSKGGKAHFAEGNLEGEDIVLIKPQTFMNLSGQAVAGFKNELGLEPKSIIIAYDDLDLPLGRIRLRKRGGSGGHRGVRSIIEHIGSEDFPRVRLGIGRPAHGDIVDYVLTTFTSEEMEGVEEMLVKGVESIKVFIKEGVDSAMNKFNSA